MSTFFEITQPSLVVQSTADMGVFPSDARAIHAAIAAGDKRLELVPGAHYFEDSSAGLNGVVDLLVDWLRERC